ncbi:Crp/Fnr family transcriptional regulator [candidate division WOR-3 bacterium]|nr:Crp/Fnr family transcriptional regulator [candidate division WOR-3 bacterium]MCK4528667.1 Crp/Fnr family transcriptional regulator [candidate division WOR-3 bacterium]
MAENDIGYEKRLQAGETLFNEGDKGDKMYLIKIGKIRIVKELEGKSKTLAILDDGAFFGEMAVLDNRPRSAAAIAETDVHLIIVDREAFLLKVNENPFIKYVISTLTQRLRKTDEMLRYFSVSNEQLRFVLYLRHKVENEPGESGVDIDTGLKADIKEIADMIGIAPDKAEEYMEQLKKFNIVEVKDTVKIKSLRRLKQYEDFISLREEFDR